MMAPPAAPEQTAPAKKSKKSAHTAQQPEASREMTTLVAEGVTGMASRAGSDSWDTARTLRRQILPHAVTAAVLGAGWGEQAVMAAGVSPVQIGTVMACTAGPMALAAWWRVRKLPNWGRRVLLGGLGAATWLSLFAPHGVDATSATALLSFEAALAARWWAENRIPDPALDEDGQELPPAPPLTEQDAPDLELAEIMADFAEYVAGKSGPWPDAVLSLPTKTDFGWQFRIQLARGKSGGNVTSARAKIEDVAGALGVGVDALIVEPHPLEESPAIGMFQILTRSPIKGDVDFDGPRRFDDGKGNITLGLGPYADGSGEAMYRLYTDGSMWSGLIIGGTGIGKSRVIENIAISAISGGDTLVFFNDPQGGVSSPALAKYGKWFTTMRDVGALQDTLLAILAARGAENTVLGAIGFTPSPERPGILVILDECHNIFADADRSEGWAKLAREGRKCGIAFLCVSQYPGVVTFGSNEALRSSVLEGNALVLRSTSNQTKQLMAGLTVDPKGLPKIPGYAYVQGAAEGERTAPFRNRNTIPRNDRGLAERWLAALPQPELDALSTTASLAVGRFYVDRHLDSNSAQAAQAALVEALRAGTVPADFAFGTAAQMKAAGTGTKTSGGAAKPTGKVGPMGKIITFPTWESFLEAPATPTAPAAPAPAPAAAASGRAVPVTLDLVCQAAELVIGFQYATTEFLGRKLRLNHAESRAVMADLQERRIVGPQGSDEARDILVGTDDLAAVMAALRGQPAPAAAVAAGGAPSLADLNPSQRVVLDVVVTGQPIQTKNIIAAIPTLSPRQVKAILSQLIERGFCHQPKYGFYAVTDAVLQAA